MTRVFFQIPDEMVCKQRIQGVRSPEEVPGQCFSSTRAFSEAATKEKTGES